MKVSKILVAASLFCLALLFALTPALNAGAQGAATATPEVIIITATPEGGSATTGDTSAAGAAPTDAPSQDGGDVPNYLKAVRATYPVLGKKISRGVAYIKANMLAYTYDQQAQFKDCQLEDGQPKTLAGDVYGWIVTITFYNKNAYSFFVTYDLKTVLSCKNVSSGAAPAASNVTGKAVGGSFEAGAQIYGFGAGTVGRLKEAKLKWVKKQFAPSDPAALAAITAAHGQNFKMLISLKGHANEVLNAGFYDQFAAWAAKLASGGADAIEIWNEMNIDREWPAGHIDPAEYTKMLAKAYAAIKAANPNTIVISGALSPTGYFNGSGGKSANGWNDDVYYQGMAAAGAAQYMDCVGIHYNEGIVPPNASSGDKRGSYPTYFFSSMLQRAMAPFPGMKGCYTELGYLSAEGMGTLPGGFAWAQDVNNKNQAEWLRDAAVLAAQSNLVRLMIIWNIDFPVSGGADQMGGYAMIRPDGSCPACATLATVLQ